LTWGRPTLAPEMPRIKAARIRNGTQRFITRMPLLLF
jgi:hypothetical protein